jgi:hypothetical protein
MYDSDLYHYRMSVNKNLATLMRVIEDSQDKMPEGEYLAAMNALGALHRIAAMNARARAPVRIPVAVAVPVPVPVAVAVPQPQPQPQPQQQRTPWTLPYNREECAWFMAQIDAEAAPFVAELKEQNRVIELKVKGGIRNAQKRRKELVQILNGFRHRRSRYYNGGIV